ncbi:DUF1330 domain-containing protein [Vibrio sp. Of7-15]|uniref:DUF1330 domain-containing protein n=1 Tax=Vibrio sp. Of7-15 TaxID=2724879 RepID=UPI001EF388E5|nr:DUF1330 domain-containing protein [Vibrio sp. Of7-15]MCG7499185.1 DUF1330 domain-containing protein [Vibrio sp. Of7-15]
MSYEMLVGLNVVDSEVYQQYREAMTPILASYGGGFGFDGKVSEVLLPLGSEDINRVFTIFFKDRHAMEQFFAHPEYLKIKEQYFQKSVASTVIIASYDKKLDEV